MSTTKISQQAPSSLINSVTVHISKERREHIHLSKAILAVQTQAKRHKGNVKDAQLTFHRLELARKLSSFPPTRGRRAEAGEESPLASKRDRKRANRREQ